MNKATLKALKGSIQKWKLIVAGEGLDNGVNNCPLCARFFSRGCSGCPVAEKTLITECAGSPYAEWLDEQYRGQNYAEERKYPFVANTKELTRLARKELRFLKSLLP